MMKTFTGNKYNLVGKIVPYRQHNKNCTLKIRKPQSYRSRLFVRSLKVSFVFP